MDGERRCNWPDCPAAAELKQSQSGYTQLAIEMGRVQATLEQLVPVVSEIGAMRESVAGLKADMRAMQQAQSRAQNAGVSWVQLGVTALSSALTAAAVVLMTHALK